MATQASADMYCYEECCPSVLGFDSVLSFDIGGGYRQDKFQWKTFPVNNPGTVLHEKWKNMEMGIIETNAQFLACDHYLLKFDFDYGWFDKQKHQTITGYDYDTGTVFEYLTSKTRGQVYDLSAAIGYQINLDCYRISVAPLVGWSYYHQRFKNPTYEGLFEGVRGEFTNVHNKSRYSWNGPWLGFAAAYQICCEWQFYVDYAFHWAELNGKITDLFLAGAPILGTEYSTRIRSSNAYGNEVTVGTTYQFCEDWYLGFKFNYKDFWTNKGHLSTEILEVREKSPLRSTCWQSFFATVDIGYTF